MSSPSSGPSLVGRSCAKAGKGANKDAAIVKTVDAINPRACIFIATAIPELRTAYGYVQAVSPHPASVPVGLPDDLPPKLTAYERWQFTGLHFTPAQSGVIGGKTIRWYREPLSGIQLFRLERGYAAPAMAAINHVLARAQWQNVAAWFSCTNMDGKPGVEVKQADKPWLGVNHMSYDATGHER
jgi:hypothetical protein